MLSRADLLVIGATLVVCGPALAADASPPGDRILLSDPFLLALAGFGPESEVYLSNRGVFHGEFADYLGGRNGEVRRSAPAPRNPGGGQLGYRAWNAQLFQERVTGGFNRDFAKGSGDIFCASATDSFVDFQMQLPQRAKLISVDIYGGDTCAEDMVIFLNRVCLPFLTPGTPAAEGFGSTGSSGTPGNFFVTLGAGAGLDLEIDNTLCTYWLRVRFGDSGSSCNCGDTLRLDKVRAEFEFPNEGEVTPTGAAF